MKYFTSCLLVVLLMMGSVVGCYALDSSSLNPLGVYVVPAAPVSTAPTIDYGACYYLPAAKSYAAQSCPANYVFIGGTHWVNYDGWQGFTCCKLK